MLHKVNYTVTTVSERKFNSYRANQHRNCNTNIGNVITIHLHTDLVGLNFSCYSRLVNLPKRKVIARMEFASRVGLVLQGNEWTDEVVEEFPPFLHEGCCLTGYFASYNIHVLVGIIKTFLWRRYFLLFLVDHFYFWFWWTPCPIFLQYSENWLKQMEIKRITPPPNFPWIPAVYLDCFGNHCFSGNWW